VVDRCTRVRSWFAALARHDPDAAVALADPDVRVDPLRFGSRTRSRFGHQGVRDLVEELAGDRSPYRVEIHDVTVLGDRSHVAATGSLFVGRIDAAPFSAIVAFRGDKIAEVRHYLSDLPVLEDLGLLSASSG
jgi:ketosteroid isomerase-like protein